MLAKMTQAQKDAQKRYNEKNKDRRNYLRNRNAARKFLTDQAEKDDIKEMKVMLEERENALKIKEVTAWLKEFGTVEQYSATKKQPKIIENAQPIDFVSFYYSTLEDERENMEFEGSYEALAEIMNLSEIKPDETFIQLLPEDFGDSTNATTFYLSEVTDKEKLMEFVNEALDMDQVTHSSGLKSRYQFI